MIGMISWDVLFLHAWAGIAWRLDQHFWIMVAVGMFSVEDFLIASGKN